MHLGTLLRPGLPEAEAKGRWSVKGCVPKLEHGNDKQNINLTAVPRPPFCKGGLADKFSLPPPLVLLFDPDFKPVRLW